MSPSIKTIFIPIVPAPEGYTTKRADTFDLSKFGLLGLWVGHNFYESLENVPEYEKWKRIIKMHIEDVRMKTIRTIEEVIDLNDQQEKLTVS